uniref:Uncharacterized protein n=1 Tax=Arundo donax TaxID=35708 RepID=A0A0A9BMG5_ARUDO
MEVQISERNIQLRRVT